MTIDATTFPGVVPNSPNVDCTKGIQNAADTANSVGDTLKIPCGVYRIDGTVNFKNIVVDADFGAVFEHHPADDLTDCIKITGSNTGRSKLKNLSIKMAAGNLFGRDLLRIDKGDFVTIEDVYVENSKRDGIHIAPYGSYQWIENLVLQNVKVQSAGRDSFGFTIPAGFNYIFINQVDMTQCESRSAVRHALRLENLSTGANSVKLSNYRFMNCEFHGAPGPDDLVRIMAAPSTTNTACIENLTFHNCAIEETSAKRTGYAVKITGRMQGKFEFKNSIMYGTADKIYGFDTFPVYEYEDIAAPAVPLYKSHSGIWKKYTTESLAPAEYQDTIPIGADEIVEGWVFNASGVFARLTVMNGTYLLVQDAVKCKVELINGVIRLTNNDTEYRTLVLYLQRITRD